MFYSDVNLPEKYHEKSIAGQPKKTHSESCLGVEYHLILAALAAVMCISKEKNRAICSGPMSNPKPGI